MVADFQMVHGLSNAAVWCRKSSASEKMFAGAVVVKKNPAPETAISYFAHNHAPCHANVVISQLAAEVLMAVLYHIFIECRCTRVRV